MKSKVWILYTPYSDAGPMRAYAVKSTAEHMLTLAQEASRGADTSYALAEVDLFEADLLEEA